MSTDTIPAIPTQYRGVQFRSRLEARWAIFFDALNIEWQYEPKKLRLVNGITYIPDFFLPSIPCDPVNPFYRGTTWIEVKPELSFYSDAKAKGIIRTMSQERAAHQIQTGASWYECRTPDYYIADQHFRFFLVWYNYSKYEPRECAFHERTIMKTRKGRIALERNIKQYGKAVDISGAIRAAQNYRFDQPGQHT